MKTNIKQRLTSIYRVAILVFVATALTLPSLVPATARASGVLGTSGSSTTTSALSAIGGASDIATVNTAMNSFLSQYSLTFSDQCIVSSSINCNSLTAADLADEVAYATGFVTAFSKIQPGLVAVTGLENIKFVTNLSTAANGPVGGTWVSSEIQYGIYSNPDPAEVERTTYHEFGHAIFNAAQLEAPNLYSTWTGSELNPPDWVSQSSSVDAYCASHAQYCHPDPNPIIHNPSVVSLTHPVDGFVSKYGTSNQQEDSAEIFTAIFMNNGYAKLAEWIPNDKYLNNKVKTLKDMMKIMYPDTDEDYFLALHGYSLPEYQQPEEDPTEEEQQPTDDTIIIRSGETRTIDNTVNNVIVEGGGTLKGTGTIRNLLVQSSGDVKPGHSPGCLTITGSYTLQGIFQAELGGDKPCTGYDQFITSGAVNLAGGTLDASSYQNYDFTIGQQFTILKNNATQPVTGTFTNLSEGSLFQVGNYLLSVSYQGGDGNDVVLTVKSLVPSAPNTGFTLIRNNPLATIATLFTAGTVILVLNRKLKLQRRWS